MAYDGWLDEPGYYDDRDRVGLAIGRGSHWRGCDGRRIPDCSDSVGLSASARHREAMPMTEQTSSAVRPRCRTCSQPITGTSHIVLNGWDYCFDHLPAKEPPPKADREKIARIIAECLGEAFEILPDFHFEPSFCQDDFLRSADAIIAHLYGDAETASKDNG
jgi:hypothetical protein